MIYRIEIMPRGASDPAGVAAANEIRLLGITAVTSVAAGRIFLIEADEAALPRQAVERVAGELLADTVVERFEICSSGECRMRNAEARDSAPAAVPNSEPRIPNSLHVEVFGKPGVMDPVALSTQQAIDSMGFSVQSVRTGRSYRIGSSRKLADAEVRTMIAKVFANESIEQAIVGSAGAAPPSNAPQYEFRLVRVPIRDLDDAGLEELSRHGHLFLNVIEMRTIRDYYRGVGREPTDIELETLAQTWSEHCVHKTLRSDIDYRGVPIPGLPHGEWNFASEEELSLELPRIQQAVLDAGYDGDHLSDWVPEGLRSALGKCPPGDRVKVRLVGNADGEIRLLANEHEIVAWGKTDLETGEPYVDLRIRNLIKSTIFAATEKLAKPWCISVFKDNAGVIEFDEKHAVCFKVETHNHPSAIEPYGGAATGIGGCIRDPMGTGMGAKPVANTDIFCFAPPDYPADAVPKGVLHPRRVMRGVVAGVRDYGNRMGIPTVNGAIYFDDRYLGNPLVFCGNVGLMDRDKCFKHQQAGDAIVVVGGRTGRDGIHGATFSSGELTHTHEDEFSHAVQIGNAITEKKMADVLNQARDRNLYNAITDCGAGGLSSAVGEMGEQLGTDVQLETVPLKYAGLSYTEIWISEAQERMVLAVPQEKVKELLALFASEDVEATVIGRFTNDRKLKLFYAGTQVGELDMAFLHDGLPKYTRVATWSPRPQSAEKQSDDEATRHALGAFGIPSSESDHTQTLIALLSHYNIASKEWVVRQYDHEVQGGSVIKPLVGVSNDGPGDGAVFAPVLGSNKGVALACGLAPKLGDLDPYQMALHAIDECVRNLVCVGADYDRIAILDNFCWGNCAKPDRLGSLVLAAQACHDGALAYGTPFISGKDSLNNEFVTDDGRTIAIPPTLLISGIGIVPDVTRCVTMDAKVAGSVLVVVGLTQDGLAGSHYADAASYEANDKFSGTRLPLSDVASVDLELGPKLALAVSDAIARGLVRSAHDPSEGGLAVAIAEMCFAGGLGVDCDLDKARVRRKRERGIRNAEVRADIAAHSSPIASSALLFSESPSRYLLEVELDKLADLEAALTGVPHAVVGRFTDSRRVELRIAGLPVISADIAELKRAWQSSLAW